MSAANMFHIPSFRIDLHNEQLWRETEKVRLTPKAFAVLRYLLQHAGQLVTKEALLAAVWPEISVSEAALVVCIRELRQALGDQARAPRFIETIHRRGDSPDGAWGGDVPSDSGGPIPAVLVRLAG